MPRRRSLSDLSTANQISPFCFFLERSTGRSFANEFLTEKCESPLSRTPKILGNSRPFEALGGQRVERETLRAWPPSF